MSSSPLRLALDGHVMDELTVLARQHDPFRVDTPAGHRDGAWFAAEVDRISRRLHLRGAHYALLGRPKPDGTAYANTDMDWRWVVDRASFAARWLGHVDFGRFDDRQHDAPVIRRHEPGVPTSHVGVDHVEVPDTLRPYVFADGFAGLQPYRLVLFGEKSSLGNVLEGEAESCGADLYLCTGEISTTFVHRIALDAVKDGRPLVVFTLSDADPAGWQMPISIARKLQAFDCLLDGLPDWQVRRVALTPAQVRAYGLPSTPLKETERRADRWREAMGVEQTEIDALATLRPDLLRDLVRQAVRPFFDETLARRAQGPRAAWYRAASARLGELVGDRSDVDERLTEFRGEIDRLRGELANQARGVDLPPVETVEAVLDGEAEDEPLIDSRWGFVERCQALIDAKRYRNGQEA